MKASVFVEGQAPAYVQSTRREDQTECGSAAGNGG